MMYSNKCLALSDPKSRRQKLLLAAENGTVGLQSFFATLSISHNETVIAVKGGSKCRSNKLISHLSEILQVKSFCLYFLFFSYQ